MGPRAFLERWGRRPAFAPGLLSALAELSRLGLDRPELAAPSRTLAGVLEAAFHPPESVAIDPARLTPPSPAPGRPAGLPAFHQRLPPFDASRVVARSLGLARVLGARDMVNAIRRGRVDVGGWAAEALGGRPGEVASRAGSAGLDPMLAASILRFALLPSLAPISSELDRARPPGAWDRGDCPNCGSRPILAESRGLEQRIYHRCGLCAGQWPGERLGCPSCGEAGPRTLEYSYVEGEQDRCRLAHCRACRYRWKVVSTLTALDAPAMIVADLATVHLDLLAEGLRESSA